jgi:hypothetical protein
VTNILGSLQAMHSPNTKEDCRIFPVMKQYNIPLEEVCVHTSLVEELYHMNNNISEMNTIFVDLGDNKKSSLLLIPLSHGYKRLKIFKKKTKWFTTLMGGHLVGWVMKSLQPSINLFAFRGWKNTKKQLRRESNILVYIAFQVSMQLPRLLCSRQAANMNELQLQTLRWCCCKAECGDYLFSLPYSIKRVLDLEYVEPMTGAFNGLEKIDWMYKSVQAIVRLYFSTLFCDYNGALKVDHIDLSLCVDHGKGPHS